MTKSQAIQSLWESFGLPSYSEETVPTGEEAPAFPYITYTVETDSIGNILLLTASVWYRSTSWKGVEEKVAEIAEYIGKYGYAKRKIDGGYVWFTKGQPFAQRLSDDTDDMVRRIILNITAEFLTAY